MENFPLFATDNPTHRNTRHTVVSCTKIRTKIRQAFAIKLARCYLYAAGIPPPHGPPVFNPDIRCVVPTALLTRAMMHNSGYSTHALFPAGFCLEHGQ